MAAAENPRRAASATFLLSFSSLSDRSRKQLRAAPPAGGLGVAAVAGRTAVTHPCCFQQVHRTAAPRRDITAWAVPETSA